MNGMSLHPYTKGVPIGRLISICAHRDKTAQDLDNLLGNTTWRETWSRSIAKHPNGLTTQCGTNDIWNQGQISPYNNCGRTQSQLYTENIPSYEVKDNDIRRAVMTITAVPAATLPESAFLLALGAPALRTVPPQTGSLAQRATEEWNETCVRTKQSQSWNRCRPKN